MSTAQITRLADRGVVSVSGPDAAKLLQGLITNDLGAIEPRRAIHAALLTPQGKIIVDFFVIGFDGGFLLECARDSVGGLVKRLSLYKLRASVEIRDASDAFAVLALWGKDHCSPGETVGTAAFVDPRHPELGLRILAEARSATVMASPTNGAARSSEAYHAHRIALGVPEGGKDFVFGDTFPHEAMMDLLHGVSFTKGCYVGQEIVSRMQHRGTARKRIVPVNAAAPLTSGAEVSAGDVAIGAIGSVAGNRGLAMIRLDRAAEFEAKGTGLAAGGVAIEIDMPEWAGAALAAVTPRSQA